MNKLGNQERKFVDFIAKNTGGLTSSFIEPGVVTTDLYSINIVTANPGTMAQGLAVKLYQNEDFVVKLGRQVRAFHDACRKFRQEEAEAYNEMIHYHEAWDGIFGSVKPCDIPSNEETFGIMHGDMHEGNFLIDVDNDYKVTFFDWDLTSKSHYMVDIGTFVQGLRIMNLFM